VPDKSARCQSIRPVRVSLPAIRSEAFPSWRVSNQPGRHHTLNQQSCRHVHLSGAKCGATPFLDEADIDVGADFEEDIHAFLKKANELVVLLTPWALERPYVVMEIGAAWIREIPIVVLLQGLTATEVQGHSRMLGLLKRRNLVLLNDIERYLEELRARVQSCQEAAT
jgi:hypothetical protein